MSHAFLGPHEGRELELMISGSKPLSMFIETVPAEFETFPEKDFDLLVSKGRLKKHVSIEESKISSGEDIKLRRVLYALPAEEWRIKAFLFVQNIYDSHSPGWRPDLDHVIGLLLGYNSEDVEKFLELHRS